MTDILKRIEDYKRVEIAAARAAVPEAEVAARAKDQPPPRGFLEALNGLFQAAKRKARGYRRLSTIRTIIFLIAGKLDFRTLNPHVT